MAKHSGVMAEKAYRKPHEDGLIYATELD